ALAKAEAVATAARCGSWPQPQRGHRPPSLEMATAGESGRRAPGHTGPSRRLAPVARPIQGQGQVPPTGRRPLPGTYSSPHSVDPNPPGPDPESTASRKGP